MKKRKQTEEGEESREGEEEDVSPDHPTKKKKIMLCCKGCSELYEDLGDPTKSRECNSPLCDECYCIGCYNAFAIKLLIVCPSCNESCCSKHKARCNSPESNSICQHAICKKCDEKSFFSSCCVCKKKYCSVCLKDCKIPGCKNLICESCFQGCEICGIDLCSEKESHICSEEMTEYLLKILDDEKRTLIDQLYIKVFFKSNKKDGEISDDQDTEEEEETLNQDDKLINQINLLIEDGISDLIVKANGNKENFIKSVEEAIKAQYLEENNNKKN